MSEPKPKLLIVTTVPETIVSILRMQPRFLNQYFSVSLATSPGPDADIAAKTEGVEVHEVSMKRGISPVSDLISIFKMIMLLLRIRPSIIHSYTPKAGLISMVAGWICRVPVRVHTFTGLIFPTQFGIKQRVLVFIDRLICACATRVIPEGLGVRKDLYDFGITNKPLQIIGHGNIAGVDTGYFSPELPDVMAAARDLKSSLLIGENDFVFCFVGRLNRDKGISELAKAFAEMPGFAHLLLVGAVDETAPVDEISMSLLRSNPNVHFLGFQSDIRPALACSNLLVLPSYREGFPNSVLQACSMALPVIATDISGCNEVIEGNVNGWLVPVKNAGELACAMVSALNIDEAGLRLMGAESRRRVQAYFEQRHHWVRMLDFYRLEMQQDI